MGWLQKLLIGKSKVMPVHVDDSNFEAEILRSEVPVMIDFWSPTCGPCKMLEPIVVDLATEFDGRIKVVEVDISRAPRVAGRFGVMATPTVLYLDKGREVERVVGFRGSLYHREIIESDLLPAQS
ncbi:MAG: thioredoxin [Pseudomonadota bacterium]